MRPTRRERRVLAEMETFLRADERLLEVFQRSVWPDQRQKYVRRWRLRDLFLQPPSHASAVLTCIVLQLCVGAVCAVSAHTGQTLATFVVVVLYPFAFTPLVKWSAQHLSQEHNP